MTRKRVFLMPLAVALQFCAKGSTSAFVPAMANEKGSIEEPNRIHSWLPDGYPSSPDNAACRSGASARFCDPDSILSQLDLESLGELLNDNPSRTVLLPPKCFKLDKQSPAENTVAVQYAIALLRKMDLVTPGASSLSAYEDSPEKAAELFARQIHDTWGVGVETASCGGTGIVLFLSDLDRTVYFSRGSALESVLTDRRLDHVIAGMKLYLSRDEYGEAITLALRELDSYLIAGEPGWKERASDFMAAYLGYFMVAGLFGLAGVGIVKDRERSREYAKVASHLNELDRARAEVLQGHFQAKSCPICLENFECAPVQSDDETSNGTDTDTETDMLTRMGSDGLPLKLLRCGHVFDDTCWAEWISSGHHGKVDKCPICQQDVGKSRDIDAARVTGATTVVNPEGRAFTSATVNDTPRPDRHDEADEARNRALLQYRHERNFRLIRLASRFPQFVRPQQIQEWTEVGYDGSLARDPGFVNSDPARPAAPSSSSSSTGGGSSSHRSGLAGGSSGFCGGSSGGGRSGRW